MPSATVISMAKQAGVSTDRAEHLWDKAKTLATKQYGVKEPKGKGGERFYRLVMGIFKKMLGLDEQSTSIQLDAATQQALREAGMGDVIRSLQDESFTP